MLMIKIESGLTECPAIYNLTRHYTQKRGYFVLSYEAASYILRGRAPAEINELLVLTAAGHEI